MKIKILNNKSIYDIKDYLVSNISNIGIFVALIFLIAYSIASTYDMASKTVLERILIGFLTSYVIFTIGFSNQVKKQFENIITTLNIKEEEKAKIQIITNQEELYKMLTCKINTAKKRVYNMHLDSHAPRYYGNKSRTEYFEFIFKFPEERDDITMRRITSITQSDKGEWLIDMINKTANIENLSIAYINAENLEETFLKTIVSCQIIDDDKIFILNPLWNTVSNGSKSIDCVYIENKKIVEVYEKYFDKLWTYAEVKHNGCCIIKNGKCCDKTTLEEITKALSKTTDSLS